MINTHNESWVDRLCRLSARITLFDTLYLANGNTQNGPYFQPTFFTIERFILSVWALSDARAAQASDLFRMKIR